MKRLVATIILSLVLSGCQGDQQTTTFVAEATTTPLPTEVATSTPSYSPVAPLSHVDALPPTLIEIPEIGLLHSIRPMEWEVTEIDGQRTTVWRLPDDAVGWHSDSVGTGAIGNVVLSGHQEQEEAVFKAVALGSVKVGQNIYLTNESGDTYVYEVIEVSDPVPLEGTTAEQFSLMEGYYSQSEQPRLTLITGWPDFSTTHRLFVVAQLAGIRS